MDAVKIKRSSFILLEPIEIKPSTELIPDEYEHFTDSKYSVHIFCDEDHEECAEIFVKTVKDLEYTLDHEKNIHSLLSYENVNATLESLKSQQDLNALILVFIGNFINDYSLLLDDGTNVKINSIWDRFSATNCPFLKHKPKLFFFYATRRLRSVQIDGRRSSTVEYAKLYDVPVEADMLIMYKKFNDYNIDTDIFTQYCNDLKILGPKHHILDIMANTLTLPAPIIVSTLTRKFYLTTSEHREQLLSITECFNSISKNLEDISLKIGKIKEIQEKKKEKKGIGFFPSFRNRKLDDKSKSKPNGKAKVETDSKTKTTAKSKESEPSSSASSLSRSTGARLRKPSESDDGKSKKPPWR